MNSSNRHFMSLTIALLVLVVQPCVVYSLGVGSFQHVVSSPFAAGIAPAWSAFSPVIMDKLFVAIPNYDDATVSVYELNQTTGFLTQVAGSPFASGVNPAALDYSPVASENLFIAVVNYNDNTVSVYSVNPSNGALTQVSGSPFATGGGPYSVAYSSVVSGNLYAAINNSFDNTVSVYSVDQTTGVFTEVVGSPFATGSGPYTVAFSPIVAGNFYAAVTNYNDNTVSVYSVDQTTGAFTQVVGSPFVTGSAPYGIDYSPEIGGNFFAAVVNLNDNTVSVYSIDQMTGAFTQVAGSPFVTGTGANEVAYSPVVSGSLFAAVVNFASNNVSVYSVNPITGAFTEVTGSPFATGMAPDGIAYSPLISGNLFAVTANFSSNDASVFQVIIPPQPPSHIKGCRLKSVFLGKKGLVNVIRWRQPEMGLVPVDYYIYRNAELTDLAVIIPADQTLEFADIGRQKDVVYTYYIVSHDANNSFSSPGVITVTERCHCSDFKN